jgi:predicted nucleotide-binding protein (sugar kinase/HSP70/actin superfamily)
MADSSHMSLPVIEQNGNPNGHPYKKDPASGPSVEDVIQQRLNEERARLEREAGIQKKTVQHFTRPQENPFTRAQRGHTTILFGGLTWKHEHLVHGALEGLGYKPNYIPTPDVKSFQLGKEYGNNGQCNPTYFTVGNLVKYLQNLEAQGLSKKEIIDNYVFITAGACGPCRFGMYEAEYRLALQNAGFDGFRVLLFQQSGGLNQSEVEAGLEMNVKFFMGLLNAFNIGDLINEVSYQIRPFEVKPGATDLALREIMDYMHEVMKKKEYWEIKGILGKILNKMPNLMDTAEMIGKFLNQLFSDYYTGALRNVRDRFNEIEVDRTRVKPIVKITGEFWAQTTEGDGNFNMFRFLEREGAEVLVEPIATWINYMIHQAKQGIRDRKGLIEGEPTPEWWEYHKRFKALKNCYSKLAQLTIAEKIFAREYNRLREALGGTAHGLTDQYELQRIAHPMYNSRAGGGEGHLEVAKNIYYHNKDLCHMVLSLKPFGCMPSTQSDGVQSAVMGMYKDMIYLPIETSGEGEINAHSRVQMALGEAKVKAKEEFKRVLEATGYTLEEIKAYVEDHPELKRPMYKIPHYKGIIGTAARFVHHVAELMRSGGRK